MREQYIQCIENFGKFQGCLPCEECIEKYPYFLVGRIIWMKHEKKGDKTVLALMHPDRARLSAVLHTRKTIGKSPAIERKKEDSTQILQKRLQDIKEKKEDPMSILEKRLREIEENKKKIPQEVTEPLFEPEPSVSLDELVKKFNNYPPSITPVWENFENFEEERLYRDLGKNSSTEKMNIISETLADIYISQNLFDKAIKIYQELSLKYPEKSGIFADSIENLKKNIKEN